MKEKIICKCGRKFNNKQSLGQHKRYCKNIKINKATLQLIYDNGATLIELSKLYNLPETYLRNNIKTRSISEANKLAHKKYPEKFKHSEETKEKIRHSRFEYFKKKTGNTPWERRQRGDMSYLEMWFYNECILKYNLTTKYDIINEYGMYPYYIDFAFLNIKLAVELDGKCHFDNGDKRIAHDIKRDKYINEEGWTVYRIRYDQNTDDTIEKFLKFLKGFDGKPKVYGDRLYERCEVKSVKKTRTREQYHEDARTKYIKEQEAYIDQILDSGIDFASHGWSGLVTEIVGCKPQKVTQWMRSIMPDFYEEKCFKRKGTKIKIQTE